MTIEELTRLDQEVSSAWNSQDIEGYLRLCADDLVWHDVGLPEPLHGKEGARQFLQSWFTAMPDMHVEVKNRVISGDTVAVEIEFTGTNTGPLQLAPDMPPIPATGKHVQGKGAYFARYAGGKLVEVHTYPDNAGMMMQLGLMSGPEG